MSKILFIDCETTDVTPLSGQIIELAGVVAEVDLVNLNLKVLDQFTTLVKNRGTWDERIQRLTGITELDLQKAPALMVCQEQWANWLEPWLAECGFICGHSVDFDLRFLQAESWLLPDAAKVIDTLPISKVLFTYLSAVNLETLVAKLDLTNFFTRSEHLVQLQFTTAHRAVYDTWCAVALLEKILHTLASQPFHQVFYQFIIRELLFLPIQFYSSGPADTQITATKNSELEPVVNQTVVKINLLGQVLPEPISERLERVCSQLNQSAVTTLVSWLSEPWDSSLKLTLAGLYTSIIYRQSGCCRHFKIHTHTLADRIFVDCLLTWAERQLPRLANLDNSQTVAVVDRLESVLWQVKYFLEEVYDIGELIYLLEIYQQLNLPETVDIQQQITKILASYDFFLLSIEPFWALNRYEYSYKPWQMLAEEKIIQQKLTTLIENLQDLNLEVGTAHHPVELEILQRIQQRVAKLRILSWQQELVLRLEQQRLVIAKPTQFSVTEITQALTRVPNLQIHTYLPWIELTWLWDWLALPDSLKSQVVCHLSETGLVQQQFSGSLSEFLQQELDLAVAEQSTVLLLTGNQRVFKKLQKALIEELPASSYLSLGEDGSLLKVMSKWQRGFVGLVHLRLSDVGFWLGQKDLPKLVKIWLIAEPGLTINRFWQQLAEASGQRQEFVQQLQRLNLLAQAGWLLAKTNLKVNYLSDLPQ